VTQEPPPPPALEQAQRKSTLTVANSPFTYTEDITALQLLWASEKAKPACKTLQAQTIPDL